MQVGSCTGFDYEHVLFMLTAQDGAVKLAAKVVGAGEPFLGPAGAPVVERKNINASTEGDTLEEATRRPMYKPCPTRLQRLYFALFGV